MKVKVSEATNLQLDWMVERALGTHWSGNGYFIFRYEGCGPNGFISAHPQWEYSTNWSQGGLIIEQQEIELHKWAIDGWEAHATNYQFLNTPQERELFCEQHGPTPLIAAMRCFVASKLGDEVEIPEELV